MNRRQAKKRTEKLCSLGDGRKQLFSYRKKREFCRKSHVMSIAYARKEHRNYWVGWTKGYPNRYRINNIYNYAIKHYETL